MYEISISYYLLFLEMFIICNLKTENLINTNEHFPSALTVQCILFLWLE